jgi:hypothetical protein
MHQHTTNETGTVSRHFGAETRMPVWDPMALMTLYPCHAECSLYLFSDRTVRCPYKTAWQWPALTLTMCSCIITSRGCQRRWWRKG